MKDVVSFITILFANDFISYFYDESLPNIALFLLDCHAAVTSTSLCKTNFVLYLLKDVHF